ncbi:MAG: hypothetical protein WBW33_13895 [Bryobacteraceae bacterium]
MADESGIVFVGRNSSAMQTGGTFVYIPQSVNRDGLKGNMAFSSVLPV